MTVQLGAGSLLEELRGGLFCVTNGQYQALVLDTGEGAVVVDAPPALATALPRAVSEITSGRVTHLIYSHAHGDHIGAAHVLAGHRPEVIASQATARLLAKHTDTHLRLPPTRTFADALTLSVGPQELRLAHRGPNHSPDNVIVHLPAQRTVMLVDVVIPGWVPFRSWTVTTDVPGLLTAHDQLLEYAADGVDTVVGGHLDRLGTPADVEVNRAYLREVLEVTARTMGVVRPPDVAAALPPAPGGGAPSAYAVADRWYDGIATRVAAELVDRWADRLGGVEVFAHSHAVTAVDALRFDYDLDGGATPPTFA